VVNLKELVMILELHQQGLSVSAIAARSGKDRKTVKRHIKNGLKVPKYKPRAPKVKLLAAFELTVAERLGQWPELSCARLFREIKALGYKGGITMLKDFVKHIRPVQPTEFEVRFETPAGQQAQVDFAYFQTVFSDEPGQLRIVWLFSMVLGHSRYLWAHYVMHQDLATVLRCHSLAFEHIGGVPREILYDRMKTAVLGERYDGSHIVYNEKLLGCANHYGFTPKACKAYRAKTKGKVERPFRYIRQDFFMGREFANLIDLNGQLDEWLATVANARVHGTTNRLVAEHLREEKLSLLPLAFGRFDAVLQLERRITNDGCVSVGGNLYSVPNGTRRRPVEVELTAHEVRILESGVVVAIHALLTGRNERSVLPGHRTRLKPERVGKAYPANFIHPAGYQVARRELNVYDAIAAKLADINRTAKQASPPMQAMAEAV
jgi:transposase